MLSVKNISYRYNDQAQFSFPDIECASGASALILGKSGVGKTTLLHLLCGLMKPETGAIVIDSKNISQLSGGQMDKYRGENIGIVFQRNHFIKSVSVLDNLLLTQSLVGNRDRDYAMKLLEILNIGHKADDNPYNLSEGEQQRVSIARALVNKPKLILADEPTSALDDVNCNQVLQLLNQQAKDINASLLIVTHDNRLKDDIPNQIILQG